MQLANQAALAEWAGTELPRISLVTPSFNQGAYLEETLRSVLDQGYPNLEYLVLDGGSTDQSLAVIERYADRLDYWVSEPDGGQYDALNRGLGRTTGAIMGWLNSDDKLMPWALAVVADVFRSFPEIDWITGGHPVQWNAKGQAIRVGTVAGYSRELFLRGGYLPGRPWFARGYLQQESTFWRRSLWERAGGRIDAGLRYAGDFELWARFFEHSEPVVVGALLGGIRKHGVQKTAQYLDRYHDEAEAVLRRYPLRLPGRLASRLRYLASRGLNEGLPGRLPAPLRRLLVRAGVLFPVRACRWDGHSWRLISEYVI